MYFIAFGLVTSLFLIPSKTIINSSQADRDQSFSAAIIEAFKHRGYVLLVLFCLRFQITLVGTHMLVICRIEVWMVGQQQLF